MKKYFQLFIIALLLVMCGCAYRHYLGMHGPSVRADPDIHADITNDGQCLACHAPGSADTESPVTSHPGFSGCLKCHND